MSWKLPADIDAARRAALEVAGRMLADDAVARAPRRTGRLAASAYSEVRDDDTVRVGFTAPYAVKQHYRQDFEHPTGDAMFLADAAGDFGPQLEDIVAEQLRRRLGG